MISANEVMALAFTASERVRPDMVGDAKIETAQLRYVKPVLGGLYDVLQETRYESFVEEYLKAPLALFVKAEVIDDATASMGSMGVVVPAPRYGEPAGCEHLAHLKKQTLRNAETLLGKAVRHIGENLPLFPEYDSRDNIQGSISRKGGIVIG